MGVFDDAVAAATARAEAERAAAQDARDALAAQERDIKEFSLAESLRRTGEWMARMGVAEASPRPRILDSYVRTQTYRNDRDYDFPLVGPDGQAYWSCGVLVTWVLEGRVFAGDYGCTAMKYKDGVWPLALCSSVHPKNERFDVWIKVDGEWFSAKTKEDLGQALIGEVQNVPVWRRGRFSQDYLKAAQL